MIFEKEPYLIGETAFHHQGDINYLKNLVGAGISSGCDAIKFHLLFDPDDYMVSDHKAIEPLRNLIIPKSGWKSLLPQISSEKYDKIFLCNDIKSLRWVNSLPESDNVVAIEIHATGLNDFFLLEEAAKFRRTVILGTGGSSIEEIRFSVDFLSKQGKKELILMHGFQNYPTDYKDVVFSKMTVLRDLFGFPVGYADHTDPTDPLNAFISVLPQAQGFNILEKHFTISEGEERIDSQAAVSAKYLAEIRTLMDKIANTWGRDPLFLSDSEKTYGDTGPMKKAVVAREKIPAGKIIERDDIAFKRTNQSTYVKQFQWPLIVGSKATREIHKDEIIDFGCIHYSFTDFDFSHFFRKES